MEIPDDVSTEQLLLWFPRLRDTDYERTSKATKDYNCIAWAAGEKDRWWWPDGQRYWPDKAPEKTTLDAFIAAFRTLDYEVCAALEGIDPKTTEVVALYARLGKPTHAARQLPDGQWTSKIGKSIDIRHATARALELAPLGHGQYGMVAAYLARGRRGPPPTP